MLATRFGGPYKFPEPEAHVFRRLCLLTEIPSKLLIGTVPINAHAVVVAWCQAFPLTDQEGELCGVRTKRGGRFWGRLRGCRRQGRGSRRSRVVAKIGETNAVLPQGADLLAGQYLQLCDGQIEVECNANRISRIIEDTIPCQHETCVTGSVGTQDELRVRSITLNRPNSLGTSIKDSGQKIMIFVALAVVVGDHARSGDVRKNDRLAHEISETNIYLQHVNAWVNASYLRGLDTRDLHHEGATAVATWFPGTSVYQRCRSNRGHGGVS